MRPRKAIRTMNGKKWRVVRDYQGGAFGMDRDYTAEQWLEQMLDWQTADGNDEKDIEREREYWTKVIATEPQKLIDYIAEVWSLEFEEIDEHEDKIWDEVKFLTHQNKVWDEIKKLDPQEWLILLRAYDAYVFEIVRENNGEPVGVPEFYEYDYQEYAKELYK